MDYLTANADGSAYPAVRADHFAIADVLMPDTGVLAKYHELVEPIQNKVAANEEESRTLAATRDALLPKLLSGEIRVKDAETFVEQTA